MLARFSSLRSNLDDAEFWRAIRIRTGHQGALLFGSCMGLPWAPTSNQAIQPMAPSSYFATLLATNPAHG